MRPLVNAAGQSAATTKAQPEILPDGNVGDAMPKAEELSAFLMTVKKNMVFSKGGAFEMRDWGSGFNEYGT